MADILGGLVLVNEMCIRDREKYVKDFHRKFPDVRIVGHNELAAKACPSFDVQEWLKEIGINQ